jgi:hypothetical protein
MAERQRKNIDFSKQLKKLEDLEKVQAAEQVAATMDTPGWRVIVDLLEGREQELLENVVSHEPVRSQAEYAAALAEVRGIRCALDAGPTVLHAGKASAAELSKSERTTG